MKAIKYIFMFAILSLMTACVDDEVFQGPSKISKIESSIAAPTSSDAVTITAIIEGLQAPEKVTLSYSVNGAASKEVNMEGVLGVTNAYQGVIPAQDDKAKVTYTISVTNTAGYTTVSDAKEYTVGDIPIDYTKLKLNECYGAADTDEGKFIELYNTGDTPIKLKGVNIKKDGADSWTGIDGEVIPAHGVFAIVGAKGSTPRGFSSGFSNKKSVLIELYDKSGTLLDKFQRGEEGAGWGSQSLAKVTGSWSRVPDGTGTWKITEPTVGAKNATTGTDDDTVVQ